MKKEFADDHMMEEIHKIREEHYTEEKGLSPKERLQRLEERAKTFITSYGYKLIPTDHGTHKLVKAT